MGSEKKEYQKFRELLRLAIGTMSQKEFAEKSDISPEHLNRMLNSKLISQPSSRTVEKILAASVSDLDPVLMFESCGYTGMDVKLGIRRHRRKMDLYERMRSVSMDILNGFGKIIEDRLIYPDIRACVQQYLNHQVEDCRITMSSKMSEIPVANKCGEFYMNGKYTWTSQKDDKLQYRITNFFTLFFVETSYNNVVLTDVAVDCATVNACGGIPSEFYDIAYQDGTDFSGLDFFAIASEEKYCYEDTAEGRLLAKIFGEDEEDENHRKLFSTLYGLGFNYAATPDGFVGFMLNHAASFQESPLEVELFENLMDLDKTEYTMDQVDHLFKDYSFMGESGTIGAVHAVIDRESKDQPFDVKVGISEEYTDVFPPCIYVSEDAFCNGKGEIVDKTKALVEQHLLKYAKELCVPTFGTTITYTSYSVQVTDNQHAIEY